MHIEFSLVVCAARYSRCFTFYKKPENALNSLIVVHCYITLQKSTSLRKFYFKRCAMYAAVSENTLVLTSDFQKSKAVKHL